MDKKELKEIKELAEVILRPKNHAQAIHGTYKKLLEKLAHAVLELAPKESE